MFNIYIYIYNNIYFFKNNFLLNFFFFSIKNPYIIFFCFFLLNYIFFKNNYIFFFIFLCFFSTNIFFFKTYINQIIKLTNKISIIHPICITFFIIFLNLTFFFKINLKKKTSYIFFFIFLGSLWSDQELFWGGFWNWDFIESGSLIIFVFYFLHSHAKKNIFFFKKNQFLFYIYLFIFNYICSQMSVHKFAKFFLYKYTYLWIIIFISIISFFKFKQFFFFIMIFFLNFLNEFSVFFFKKFIFTLFIYFFNFYKQNLIFIKKKKHHSVNFVFLLYIIFFSKIFSKKYILLNIKKSKYLYIKNCDIFFTNFKVKKLKNYYYQLFNYKPYFFFKKYYSFNFNSFLNFL